MKKPIFKNPSGAHYLKALFYEVALESDRDFVLYTLKQEPHMGFPSLHALYIECDDPTEYEFAKKCFASWSHWKMVRECTWFKPHYELMKEELELSIRSRALVKVREAIDDPRNTVQVGKYLLEGGWMDKKDTRGRPSKEKIKQEADKLFAIKDEISEDYGRIVSMADGR